MSKLGFFLSKKVGRAICDFKMLKDNDNSNLCRLIELRAKILGLTKDNNAQQVQVNINDTLDKLRQPLPIDVTTSQSKG